MESSTEASSDECVTKPMESSAEEASSDEYVTKAKRFVCTYTNCKAAFTKARKLTNHIRRHTGERPFACDELGCNKTYTNSSHLLRHKKVYHQKFKERVSCNIGECRKEFANKCCLKKHVNRFHNSERQYPFTCTECKEGFHKKRQLQQHAYFHSGKMPFSCDSCDARFMTVSECNRHKRTHTKYPCECGVVFERWTALLLHRKECRKKNLFCTVCNKKFLEARYLNRHKKIHVNEDNKNIFMCPYKDCLRYYLYKNNLGKHIKSFHEKVPKPKIPCKFDGCNKLFSKMQNYKSHILRHSEPRKERPARKPRKDKGCYKKSTLSKLCGLTLPLDVEKKIISGDKVNLELYKK